MVIEETLKFNNMKKTILLSVIALAATVNLQAQEENRPKPERGPRMTQESARHRHVSVEKRPELAPEQWAALQTKKMTLALDLDSKQQKAVEKLMRHEAKERQYKKAQSFTRQLARLDQQIEHKSAMKAILNDSQYEQWSHHFTEKPHRETQEKGRPRKRKKQRGNRSSL